MRSAGRYCIVDGVTYRTGSSTPAWAFLWLDDEDPPRSGVLRTGENDRGRWAKVRWDVVDRLFDLATRATLDGGEVAVMHKGGDHAFVITFDKQLAEARGFAGDQHDLWRGEVPTSELTDVVESVTDVPRAHLGGDGS